MEADPLPANSITRHSRLVCQDYFVLRAAILVHTTRKENTLLLLLLLLLIIIITRYSLRNAPINAEIVFSAGFKEHKKTKTSKNLG